MNKPNLTHQARWNVPLITEIRNTGKRCYIPRPFEVETEMTIPENLKRKDDPRLPEVSELELVRHVVRLSQMNYGVDLGPIPLGSCTMKYNPKINETIARIPEFALAHPLQPEETVQGTLKAMWLLEESLKELTGFSGVSLQPAAGAHGELTGVLMIRAYHRSRGEEHRDEILIPDSAHGTNPASAAMAGYKVVEIPSNEEGRIDLEALEAALSERTAGMMITNPNTLGIFETNILKINKMSHEAGGLIYLDGANFNGIMGVVRPADMGFDVMHINLHKTFSTPHGGGGPGSGVVLVNKTLEPYLPVPRIKHNEETDSYHLSYDYPESIGKIHGYYGNIGVVIRALAYIVRMGGEGLRDSCITAVVNANYLMKKVSAIEGLELPQDPSIPRKHEFVASSVPLEKKTGVNTLKIAKRLLDYKIHAPTIYFPLIIHEALMVEPTESESKETLDEITEALKQIVKEAHKHPEVFDNAPTTTASYKLDELNLAKQPVLSAKMAEELERIR